MLMLAMSTVLSIRGGPVLGSLASESLPGHHHSFPFAQPTYTIMSHRSTLPADVSNGLPVQNLRDGSSAAFG